MKVQIRRSVFETNSSSTHSLTICTEEEFKKFKEGKLFLNYDDELVEDNKGESDGCITYEEFFEDYNLENFTQKFTSPSGDKMVAFGRYGYDG